MSKPTTSKRAKSHNAMLKKALAQPGVHEYMRVYQHWQKTDEGLNPYREATTKTAKVVTSDRSNISY